MFRLIDNETGDILAVCFDEQTAKKLLSSFPGKEQLDDGETFRYVYEDCFQHGSYLIGQTIAAIGQKIMNRWVSQRVEKGNGPPSARCGCSTCTRVDLAKALRHWPCVTLGRG